MGDVGAWGGDGARPHREELLEARGRAGSDHHPHGLQSGKTSWGGLLNGDSIDG